MPHDEVVTAMLERIDAKMTSLKKLRQSILAEFGNGIDQAELPGIQSFIEKPSRMVVKVKRTTPTAREKVISLLKESGPQSRAALVVKSGIPVGTLATVLNDKTTFESKGGEWHLVEGEAKKD